MADDRMSQTREVPHVVVVGGGVAGLAAAFFLRNEPVRVTVLEGSSRIGGQLAVSELAGTVIDEGAESTYARRPKTARLLKEAGLDDRVVSAGTKAMGIRTGDEIRPLPDRQFMGVPCDMDELAKSGILSDAAVGRAREDAVLPMSELNGDVSVAEFVGGRLGREVVDRLVDPFLADAYFGRADELSLAATLSPLVAASRRHASLAQAAGALIPPLPATGERPPTGISTLVGGLGRMPQVLADALLAESPGSVVRTEATVRELARGERGWRLTVGSTAGTEYVDADAVVVAVPAGAAGRLLAGAPGTAGAVAALAEIPHAGSVIITLAYPRDALAAIRALGHSGYRVPAVDGRPVKVVTFSTVKWPHMAGEAEIVRCQAGEAATATCWGATTPTSSRSRRPRSPRPPGWQATRWRRGSGAGRTRCPSTRSGIWTGWRGSARRWRASPRSRSAAPCTTASGSDSAWSARSRPSTRCWARCVRRARPLRGPRAEGMFPHRIPVLPDFSLGGPTWRKAPPPLSTSGSIRSAPGRGSRRAGCMRLRSSGPWRCAGA